MTTSRFAIRFPEAASSNSRLDYLRTLPGIKLLDETQAMALVEMENSYATLLKQTLPDAVITSIATYELPDTRPKIKQAPLRRSSR
jgi:hypothetical protein